RYQQKSLLAATAAGLNHLISFPKKVQVHFGQDNLIDCILCAYHSIENIAVATFVKKVKNNLMKH
ncbi:MAG: hypothetical protein IIT45_12180, partial [Treponema sp.]|nr:hypothetical protein [Treponema sp.]